MPRRFTALLLIIVMLVCICSCHNENIQAEDTDRTKGISDTAEATETTAEVTTDETLTTDTPETTQIQTETPQTTEAPAPEPPPAVDSPTAVNNDPPPQPEQTSHTHKYTAVKTAATCQQQGYTTYTCSCGHSYRDNYVNGSHNYVNNCCSYCGKCDTDNLYNYLKDWVINHGTLNGDYVYYTKSSDNYGGYSDETFSLYYWANSEHVEFCLHSVINDEFSINIYIYVPQVYTGKYEYITDYYYRDSLVSLCQSKGYIDGSTFSRNYPLNSTSYLGPFDLQNDFMKLSHEGICYALSCLGQFLQKENMGYTLSGIGFVKFS